MQALGVRIRIAPGADLSADPSTYPWQAVTEDWLASAELVLAAGQQDEDNEGDAEAALTLRNGPSKTTGAGAGITGRYTQDNPYSDLWPLWTLSCPVEIAYDWGDGYQVVAVQYVSSMRMQWTDNSGRRPTVELDLGGRLRQEQIGAEVRSAMVATTLSQAPTCLWPMEGAPDSAVPGKDALTLVGAAQWSGTPRPVGGAGAADFSDGGQMIASTGLAGAPVASWEAECVIGVNELPSSFPGSDIRRAVAWQMPNSDITEVGVVIEGTNTPVWRIGAFYSAVGARSLLISDFVPEAVIVPGETYHVRLKVQPWPINPADMQVDLYVNDVLAGQVFTPALAVTEPIQVGANYFEPNDVILGRPPANASSVSQVALWVPARASTPDRTPPMRGYDQEQAHDRLVRVSTERGVPYSVTATRSTRMGPQPTDTYVRIVRDLEATDRGIVDDSLGVVGYRAGSELYNQTPSLAIDAALWELGGDYAPTLDDQRARSDTTATNAAGDKARVDSGRTPRYTGSLSANVTGQRSLRNAASWRNHEGKLTTRYPSISVDLAANPHLIPDVMGLRLGDIGTLDNPPRGHAPGQRLLQVRGWTATLSGVRGPWTWVGNAVDGALYEAFQLETGTGNRSRLPAGVSTLDDDYGPDDLVLSVTSAVRRWVDTANYPSRFAPDAPMVIVIAGEVMEATDISGTGLTQAFTVARGALRKALPAGSRVQLYRAPVIAR